MPSREDRSPRSKTPRRHPAPPTGWGDVAEWYDQLIGEEGSEFHRHVVLPGAVRLLDPQAGQSIVDIACGQGVLCRLLQQQGMRVVGIDAAAELIRAARQRGPINIEYHIGDARDLSALPAGAFDAAACILAIQNIHPIVPVFKETSRLLHTGGRFVLVMMHPCFRGAKETSWGWDDEQKVQFRRVDRYLIPRKTPIVTHPGQNPGGYTWTFDKPLEAYVKALSGAGLLIDAMEEWVSHKTSDSGPRAGAENTARKEIPMFLALRAIKIPAISRPHPND